MASEWQAISFTVFLVSFRQCQEMAARHLQIDFFSSAMLGSPCMRYCIYFKLASCITASIRTIENGKKITALVVTRKISL